MQNKVFINIILVTFMSIHRMERLSYIWSFFCSYFLFLTVSVLGDCIFLRICPLFLGCPLYWHTAVHSWRRQWQPTPVLLPGKSHGRRSLMGCSPWGCSQSGTTSLSLFTLCIGKGNGNPLWCSCLENPRDGKAWWAAVYGVAELDTTEAT